MLRLYNVDAVQMTETFVIVDEQRPLRKRQPVSFRGILGRVTSVRVMSCDIITTTGNKHSPYRPHVKPINFKIRSWRNIKKYGFEKYGNRPSRYRPLIPNCTLTRHDMRYWTNIPFDTRRRIRLNDTRAPRDHNPKYRLYCEKTNCIMTFYNGYKPIRITSPQYDVLVELGHIGNGVRILRGTEAAIRHDIVMMELGEY